MRNLGSGNVLPRTQAYCKIERKKESRNHFSISTQISLKTRFPNNSVPASTRPLASLSFLCLCI
uniref:Uncharacterized protein n=1 Tax=Salix viminalis TaxID=40686 RepID=A0A6N2MEF5_SALVM